jgi:hypothetical protein
MAQIAEARIPDDDLGNHAWPHCKPNTHIYEWLSVAHINWECYIEEKECHTRGYL